MLHEGLEEKKFHYHKGYVLVYYKEHPRSWKNGLIYYHRLVVENHLNRYLTNDEEIHHIDGDPKNNSIENLKVLSSEEHARYHREQHNLENNIVAMEKICPNCNKTFKPGSVKKKYCCKLCSDTHRTSDNKPPKEELEKLVWEIPSYKLAERYGVSDTTIKNWCRGYDIEKPYKGYWTQLKFEQMKEDK